MRQTGTRGWRCGGQRRGSLASALMLPRSTRTASSSWPACRPEPSTYSRGSARKPARPGAFVGKARVVSFGRTIIFTEAELFDADGDLVARGTFTNRAMRGELAGAEG